MLHNLFSLPNCTIHVSRWENNTKMYPTFTFRKRTKTFDYVSHQQFQLLFSVEWHYVSIVINCWLSAIRTCLSARRLCRVPKYRSATFLLKAYVCSTCILGTMRGHFPGVSYFLVLRPGNTNVPKCMSTTHSIDQYILQSTACCIQTEEI